MHGYGPPPQVAQALAARQGQSQLRSTFPDRFEDQEIAQRKAQPPGPIDELVRAILSEVRSANVTVSPPAHVQPPIWANAIDLSARVTVPAAAGNYATAISITAPPGRWARIDSYGVNVLDPAYDYDGSILWRFLLNGIPLPEGMSDWGIQRGSIFMPRKTYIVLNEGDVLDFQVQRAVAAGADQDVEMALTGWTWRLRNNYEGTAGSVTAF